MFWLAISFAVGVDDSLLREIIFKSNDIVQMINTQNNTMIPKDRIRTLRIGLCDAFRTRCCLVLILIIVIFVFVVLSIIDPILVIFVEIVVPFCRRCCVYCFVF